MTLQKLHKHESYCNLSEIAQISGLVPEFFNILLSFGLQTYYGRRILYLLGLVAQLLILIAAGIIGTLEETPGHLWAIAGLIIAFIFVFDLHPSSIISADGSTHYTEDRRGYIYV